MAFFRGEERVKTHLRHHGRGRQTDPADLPPERAASCWWNTLAHLRQAQGILRLVETFGPRFL